MSKVFGMAGVAVLLTATFGGVGAVIGSDPAEAATCTYSDLTSKYVKNNNCKSGAYGYKSSANATVGTRAGDWVAAGYYSNNWTYTCYAYPTMVRK